MKRVKIFCLLLVVGLVSQEGKGQLKPDFFPEDIDAWDEQGRCNFCQPGVRNRSRSRGLALVYDLQSAADFIPEDARLASAPTRISQISLLMVDVKIPLIVKENFKFLLSYKYLRERYAFKTLEGNRSSIFQLLSDFPLKSHALGFIASKSINEDTYLAIQGKYANNGNYASAISLRSRSAIYQVRGVVGFKRTEDIEWGVGLNHRQSFRRINIIPFLVLNRNFSSQWGLESVLPAYAFLRYNLDDRNILLFGPQYVSRSYQLSNPEVPDDPFDYAINHSEILTSLRWQHQWIPWLWSSFRLGYRFNFSTDFESRNPPVETFRADPTDSPSFQISLFLSPPRLLAAPWTLPP